MNKQTSNKPPTLLLVAIATFLFCLSIGISRIDAQDDTKNEHNWSKAVIDRIANSDNKKQLQQLLKSSEREIQDAVSFIIINMPKRDLDMLTAEFLLNDIRLATKIQKQAKWKIDDQLFYNDVLPYANIDETREAWRGKLNKICSPIVADCKTPGKVAQRLNEKLFAEIKVKYSTKREKANQSPAESIEQGLASCTGLSILLVDACRSVGVPARLAGIPSWPNKRGNHTWVEIWDNGQWHFTGAAEPSDQGLNHAWFQGDAALAKTDSKLNAIYAVSFAKTNTVFPLVWSDDKEPSVFAVNVTERYAKKTIAASNEIPETVAVYIRVWNADKTERVSMPIKVVDLAVDSDKKQLSGRSRDDQADMNDMLQFDLKKNHEYEIRVGGKTQKLRTSGDNQQTVDVKADKQ